MTKKNQTDPKHLMGKITDDDEGIGIFYLPDVEQEGDEAISKIIVAGVTYEQCVKRGRRAIAFKWLPKESGNSFEKQIKNLRRTSCTPRKCVDTCVQDGCACVNGFCQ